MSVRRIRIAAAAAAALVIGAAVAPAPAEAGWRGRNYGGAVAAGVIGGLALGALAAGAARPAYGYAPAPVYAAPPAYGYAPVYDRYQPVCRVVRERVQVDPWTVQVRKYRICD